MKKIFFLVAFGLLALVASFSTKTARADNVISDDLIVTGSYCVGYDCATDGTENFSFDTIRLKENNLRIKFADTTTTAGFPATQWQIIVNDSTSGGRNYFGVDNVTDSQPVMRIYPDALAIGQGAVTTESADNSTAIGYQAYVEQANSLVLGSVNGVNGATSSVNVGIGTSAPARQLHLAGSNAVFRMDRTKDTAAFLMVRTDTSGNPMKTFVVGTNASASGVGTFVINDLGTNVSGGGTNRMTINNDGSVNFTGTITAAGQYLGSSIALKNNVRTYENALETVSKLRGVKFDWKDSGKPSVGLIAEEVEGVIPEVVAHNDGNSTGVNYASLVGVLVEAVKEQQKTIQEQQKIISALSEKVSEHEHLLRSK